MQVSSPAPALAFNDPKVQSVRDSTSATHLGHARLTAEDTAKRSERINAAKNYFTHFEQLFESFESETLSDTHLDLDAIPPELRVYLVEDPVSHYEAVAAQHGVVSCFHPLPAMAIAIRTSRDLNWLPTTVDKAMIDLLSGPVGDVLSSRFILAIMNAQYLARKQGRTGVGFPSRCLNIMD
jgi:hypothetical protein